MKAKILTLFIITSFNISCQLDAQSVVGLWKLIKVEKGEESITDNVDPNGKQFVHIRPDMRYRLRLPDNTFTQGYWHMDGHNPEFTLINNNRINQFPE